jgi:predicted HNH restriction endonuclease
MSRLYQETLRSERWRRLKYRRLVFAGFRCEECAMPYLGKRSKGAMKHYHLHHQSYARVGSEKLTDVLILCPECHLAPGRHPWRGLA